MSAVGRCLRPFHPASYFSSIALTTLKGKSNICLMGLPGYDYASIGKKLSNKLGMPWYDNPIGTKNHPTNIKKTIISLNEENLSGRESLAHFQKDGIIVFIDTPNGNTPSDVLDQQRSTCEECYDVRVLVGNGATETEIADDVMAEIQKDQRFSSTRDVSKKTGDKPVFLFSDTIRLGLSSDRGLFFPRHIPHFSLKQLDRLVGLSYQEKALRILERFAIADLHPSQFRQMINEAYESFESPTNPLPISKLNKNHFLMEEYHGPTASFKDLALQLTPKLFQYAISSSGHVGQDFLFIVATSGDTGSACLDGFGKTSNTPVIVLYPAGGVSPVQWEQMVSSKGDVMVLGVEDSDFDFCQTTVKDIFNSPEIRSELQSDYNVELTSGNSINWGRLFPQIPYTFHAYLELVKKNVISMGDPMDLCVPSGNFGNILGGVFAKRMGLPVRRLIAASNENNILADFLQTGKFDRRDRTLVKTSAPSIDILLPSNLERYLYMLVDNDASQINKWFDQLKDDGHFQLSSELRKKMQSEVIGGWCNSQECRDEISHIYKETGILIDPHTAVGKVVANRSTDTDYNDQTPMVIASTAHFSKFPNAMLTALDKENSDATVEELIKELKGVPSVTPFHSKMEKMGRSKIIHSKTVPANKEAILKQVRKFLKIRRERKSNQENSSEDLRARI